MIFKFIHEIVRIRGCCSVFELLFIVILFTSCALDIPEDAFDYLAPPIISCYQVPGDTEHIYVTFVGYNKEYYFQGYNVYVSDTQMLRASVASYTPVQVDMPGYASAIPSYPLPPTGSQTGTIILDQYWCADGSKCPFDNATYWIMLGSYHQILKVMEAGVSNQVSINFTK
jgi:hypothetical protein